MNWVVARASSVGTSHIASNKPCEDSCFANVDYTFDGQTLLGLFVSDGAGSASFGGLGAEIATKTCARFVKALIDNADQLCDQIELSDHTALDLIRDVRAEILDQALERSLEMRDFSCTLLGLISTGQKTLGFQIGDGAIVVGFKQDKSPQCPDEPKGEATGLKTSHPTLGSQNYPSLQLAFEPMNEGEYANMTYFITDESAVQKVSILVWEQPLMCAAVLSDGLQRLALNLSSPGVCRAHEPFFTQFFKKMADCKPMDADTEDALDSALMRFLDSPAVAERTDDDKTLVLALKVQTADLLKNCQTDS